VFIFRSYSFTLMFIFRSYSITLNYYFINSLLLTVSLKSSFVFNSCLKTSLIYIFYFSNFMFNNYLYQERIYNRLGLINRKVPSLVLECQIGTRF